MWPQIINVALGLWLMAAPAVLSYGGSAAKNNFVVGPLVATFACIAIWEATRPVRWVNLPFGLWLVASPWAFEYPLAGKINCVLAGMAIAALSCLGGKVEQRFGGGWSSLWNRVPD